MSTNLDEMIKSYSDELMRFARDNNIESLVIKNEAQPEAAVEEDTRGEEAEEPTDSQQQAEEAEEENEQTEETADSDEVKEIPTEDELENYATFKSRVFTGFGAYPVENAKVVLYKNDILHAFLVTDKNGETQGIKIESYPELNSLEPLNDEQRTDYSADVYADGFIEKKNLLVSAVGGADVVLNVELTPESEGIN